MHRDFIDHISTIFTVEKIKNDLFDNLESDDNFMYSIVSEGRINYDIKNLTISKDDKITILEFNIQKRYCMLNFFPFRVVIIIGEYLASEDTGYLSGEKCEAELFYNSDFEIVTFDFMH